MPEKQNALRHLLAGTGRVHGRTLARPTLDDLSKSPLRQVVEDCYRRLGGIGAEIPLRLGNWDAEYDGIAVELDEQLHFNRYRLITLESPVYSELPSFPLKGYRGFCVSREAECLRAGSYGGKWSNSSCSKQFGCPSAQGDLNGNGAPRWKQRAYYDFVKDLSPFLLGMQVARISIWDILEEDTGRRSVLDALQKPDVSTAAALVDLIYARSQVS